jgi:beta-mannanase
MNLVPNSVDEPNGVPDPSAWEPSCAAGNDNAYAAALAQNLVAAGFGNAVIRLGLEMNGNWEPDFMGTTMTEQQQWAQCFAQEVGAMRSVNGAHFLFDWDPNACVENVPLENFYPGNAAVDIIGVDAYDAYCNPTGEPSSPGPAAFSALASEPDGLNAVTAFAAQQGKPMSLPEWGTVAAPTGMGDDGYYVQAIGQWVASNDVAFQSYFDAGDDGVLALDASNPNTLSAYIAAFG